MCTLRWLAHGARYRHAEMHHTWLSVAVCSTVQLVHDYALWNQLQRLLRDWWRAAESFTCAACLAAILTEAADTLATGTSTESGALPGLRRLR